ncbi:MAG: DUF92 domain-containing protein [archaeon]|nr:DUF92 domain-containing protein [archaeon]
MVIGQELEALIAAFILLLFSFIAHKKGLLSTPGILLACAVGLMAFMAGGFLPFIALVVFYIVAETATNLAREKETRHEQRTYTNILGNSGAAIIALFLGSPIAFFGAVSAALSDTISSEIGMLSQKKPILITTLERVPKGTDGGITLLGVIAAFLGAAIMGAFYYLAFGGIAASAIIVGAGIIGSVVDSILGAVFERKGSLDNTHVNFLASCAGALFAAIAYALI